MKDKLEKFVGENRPSFDDLRPDSRLLFKIQSKIDDQKRDAKVLSFKKWIPLAAAACFLGVIVTIFCLKNENVVDIGMIVDNGTKAKIIDTNASNNAVDLNVNSQNQETQPQTIDEGTINVILADNSKSSKDIRGAKISNVSLSRPSMNRKTNVNALSQEMEKNRQKKQSFFNAIYNMESASTRLNAATVGSSGDKMDKDIIDALFNSMNNDPNTNVRMAALESLAYFGYEKSVKKKLIDGLKLQNDPLVKVALIQYLTAIRATSIRPDLQKMAGDEATPKYLRDQAYHSLMRMEL